MVGLLEKAGLKLQAGGRGAPWGGASQRSAARAALFSGVQAFQPTGLPGGCHPVGIRGTGTGQRPASELQLSCWAAVCPAGLPWPGGPARAHPLSVEQGAVTSAADSPVGTWTSWEPAEACRLPARQGPGALCALAHACAKLIQSCPTATPWTVACQAPLSKGFSRQEYWSGLPCPPPGDPPRDGTRISYVSCTGRQGLVHESHLGSLRSRAETQPASIVAS